MEPHELTAIVAAVLTTRALGAAGNHASDQVIAKYREIFDELQKDGGAVLLRKPPPPKLSKEALEALKPHRQQPR